MITSSKRIIEGYISLCFTSVPKQFISNYPFWQRFLWNLLMITELLWIPKCFFSTLFLCRSNYSAMISLCCHSNDTEDNLRVRHPAMNSYFRQTATLVCSDAQVSLVSIAVLFKLIIYWRIGLHQSEGIINLL